MYFICIKQQDKEEFDDREIEPSGYIISAPNKESLPEGFEVENESFKELQKARQYLQDLATERGLRDLKVYLNEGGETKKIPFRVKSGAPEPRPHAGAGRPYGDEPQYIDRQKRREETAARQELETAKTAKNESIINIAKLISEDVKINNGLILERRFSFGDENMNKLYDEIVNALETKKQWSKSYNFAFKEQPDYTRQRDLHDYEFFMSMIEKLRAYNRSYMGDIYDWATNTGRTVVIEPTYGDGSYKRTDDPKEFARAMGHETSESEESK